jgi:hypothetical protein
VDLAGLFRRSEDFPLARAARDYRRSESRCSRKQLSSAEDGKLNRHYSFRACLEVAANRSPFFTTLHDPPQFAGFSTIHPWGVLLRQLPPRGFPHLWLVIAAIRERRFLARCAELVDSFHCGQSGGGREVPGRALSKSQHTGEQGCGPSTRSKMAIRESSHARPCTDTCAAGG